MMMDWIRRNYLKVMYVLPLLFLVGMVLVDRFVIKIPLHVWYGYMGFVVFLSVTRYRILLRKCPTCQKHVNMQGGKMVAVQGNNCPHCGSPLRPTAI